LFWKSHAVGEPADPHHSAEPLAFVAIGGLLAGLVGLTVFAGPIMGWLEVTAAALHAPDAYITANQLPPNTTEGN
jgi:multicomponent K+:H+ antiporter subunit D